MLFSISEYLGFSDTEIAKILAEEELEITVAEPQQHSFRQSRLHLPTA